MLSAAMHQNVTYNTVVAFYDYWAVILLKDGVYYGVYREKDLCVITPPVHCICVKVFILMLV